MADLTAVLADLHAETDELDAIVSGLSDAAWATPTPATPWTIAHQIGHLAWTDGIATQAATDPDGFLADLQRNLAQLDTYVDQAAAERAALAPPALLAAWRAGRATLSAALESTPEHTRIIWFGPSMSPTSMATARLMETWAHGQDVADALDVIRLPTPRLRHVAYLGTRTREFSYRIRNLEPPTEPMRVTLDAPDGSTWSFGPPDADQFVTGPALDFCLLVTQRRHRDELSLSAVGADASTWLDIAQAFAGPPGTGRVPPG